MKVRAYKQDLKIVRQNGTPHKVAREYWALEKHEVPEEWLDHYVGESDVTAAIADNPEIEKHLKEWGHVVLRTEARVKEHPDTVYMFFMNEAPQQESEGTARIVRERVAFTKDILGENLPPWFVPRGFPVYPERLRHKEINMDAVRKQLETDAYVVQELTTIVTREDLEAYWKKEYPGLGRVSWTDERISFSFDNQTKAEPTEDAVNNIYKKLK